MKVVELIRALRENPLAAETLLASFVEHHAFPIVEGDTATFFFYDGHATKGVHLMHWVFGLESRQPFQRILGTDAFYLSIELPHSARVEYKYEVLRGGNRTWIRDPHNSRAAFDPFGANSVCPMPGYVDPQWIEPERGCCLLYTSPSPRDRTRSRMPSSA